MEGQWKFSAVVQLSLKGGLPPFYIYVAASVRVF